MTIRDETLEATRLPADRGDRRLCDEHQPGKESKAGFRGLGMGFDLVTCSRRQPCPEGLRIGQARARSHVQREGCQRCSRVTPIAEVVTCPPLTRDLVSNRDGHIALWCNSATSRVRNTIHTGIHSPNNAASEESEIAEMRIVTSLARKEAGRRSERPYKSAKSEARETTVVGTLSPATVLVVDDDPSVPRSLNRLISVSGFHVKAFSKPSELLASEIPRSNACMVVDIDMPEMTGIEMCEVLKASGRGLPMILITGRTDAKTRLMAAQSDAVSVLFKPFDKEPLLDAIGRALALSTRDGSEI